jgi:hypothetical protein
MGHAFTGHFYVWEKLLLREVYFFWDVKSRALRSTDVGPKVGILGCPGRLKGRQLIRGSGDRCVMSTHTTPS